MTFEQMPAMLVELSAKMDAVLSALNFSQEKEKTAEKFLSQKELCARLQITEPTAIRWCNAGKIPYLTIGGCKRFDLEKVIATLEKSTKKGGRYA